MSPRRKSLSSNAYEHHSRIPPVPSVPGAGGLGHRLQAPCLAGRGAGRSTSSHAPATSSPSPPPARARRPTRCASPPSCCSRGVIQRVTVVAPTEHLKTQWADAAGRVGIHIDPHFTNAQGRHNAEFDGVALTYAQVASKPLLHRARTEAAPTLVILDEVHHGGDNLSWGDAIREAFEPATRRLAPDRHAVPLGHQPDPVRDLRDRTATASAGPSADYTYGYAEALRDGVVRPVLFLAYGGAMRWRTKAGDEVSARLGEPLTKDLTAHAWRTALDAKGEWIPAVLAAADRRLTEVRRGVPDARRPGHRHRPDPGPGLRQDPRDDLRREAGRGALRLRRRRRAASRRSPRATSAGWWPCGWSPRGSTCPRLSVGVYATSTSTPLFFAQAVGRFVRARRRGETASVFLPSVPLILEHAARLEDERDHALDRPKSRQPRGLDVGPGGRAARCGQPHRVHRRHRPAVVRGAGVRGAVRPRAVRRRAVRARRRRPGSERGGGLPRPARPARARPGGHPAA